MTQTHRVTAPDSARLYPSVQKPIAIGTLDLPHRIITGSMHLNLEAIDRDGRRLAAFYAERARGGAGLIVTGGAAVSETGAGGSQYALINDPAHWDRWRAVVDAVHAAGSTIALQLFHAGRYASEAAFGIRPVGPSAVYSSYSRSEPVALTADQIAETIRDFASGAARAIELGFDAVEVMGSEGYLLNQFASPVTNHRDDEWGGDAERRRALPVAVVSAVRQAVGEKPVLVRMSGADLVPGSSTPAEVGDLAVALAAAGADALDVGLGWHESRVPTVQSIVPHGMWVDAAARVRTALVEASRVIPVIASNRINSVEQAEEILASGRVDLVSMARPLLADPDILAKSFTGRSVYVNTCIGCNEACVDRSLGAAPVSCMVNPRAGRELEFPLTAEGNSARVSSILVVGAGPAGMEAARALASAGFAVTLRESGSRIGGQFLMAGLVPGKEDFLETVRYFENELARLGVSVEVDTPVDSMDDVAAFDHVVVATGVRPRRVSLPGMDVAADGRPSIIDYSQAFADVSAVGEQVAIIGAGGIAVDLAHLLVAPPETVAELNPVSSAGSFSGVAERARRDQFIVEYRLEDAETSDRAEPTGGRQVTLMRRVGAIGAGMGLSTRWAVVQSIRSLGARTLTGVAYLGVEPNGIRIVHEGEEQVIAADTVIVAAGPEPRNELAELLAAAGIAHTVVGGARGDSDTNAVVAFDEGLRCAEALAEQLA